MNNLEESSRSLQWLYPLYRISEGLNQATNEREVCESALAGAVTLPGIDAGWIMLNAADAPPRVVAVEGIVGTPTTNWAMMHRDASITLWAGDHIFGVMNLVSATGTRLSQDEMLLLQGVGNQVGIALERAHLRSHLERMVEERTQALVAENLERKAAEEEAKRRLDQLHALHTIDKTILSVQPLPTSLAVIVEQVALQLQVDAVDLLLYDRAAGTLRYGAGTGFHNTDIERTFSQMGKGHVGRVAANRQLDFVADLRESSDFLRSPWLQREGFISYLAVPLVVQEELKGMLEIFHRAPLHPTEEWLEFLQALGLQTAIAIDHGQLFAQTRHLLQRSQEEAYKVTQIMDTVPEGVLFLDRDYTIQLTNDAGTQSLALLTDAKVGDKLTRLGECSIDEVVALAGQVAWQELAVEDGSHIFEIAVRPMRTDEHIEGWVLVVREVTLERHTQQRMQVQERLATVGQLAAGIAHDFNNLLVPITLYSELLLAAASPGSRVWSNSEKILLAANRAKELVRQILAFSRQVPTDKREPVQLQSLIKEVLKLLWATLPSSIEVYQEIAPDVGSVLANPVEIHQVLMNLCTNAYHAMQKDGGSLTIHLDAVHVDDDFATLHPALKAGPHVRLAVRDTGHGIEPAVMERIFDPFFTTKPAGEGTGMGLSVVYGIVRGYGGAVMVESVPGEGTTFSIYLPELHAESESVLANLPELAGGNEHILLVDDEESIVQVTRTLLTELGYQVAAHSNSLDALAHFRAQPTTFDLVITDLTMPQVSGITLAQAVLALRPEIPILLISGAQENLTAGVAEAVGIDAALTKPFLAHELAARVRSLLDKGR